MPEQDTFNIQVDADEKEVIEHLREVKEATGHGRLEVSVSEGDVDKIYPTPIYLGQKKAEKLQDSSGVRSRRRKHLTNPS